MSPPFNAMDWSSYTSLEVTTALIIVAYLVNYFYGRFMNNRKIQQIEPALRSLLSHQFSKLTDTLNDSPNVSELYATGRRGISGCRATFTLQARQDLISTLTSLTVGSSGDKLSLEFMGVETADQLVALLSRGSLMKALSDKETEDWKAEVSAKTPPPTCPVKFLKARPVAPILRSAGALVGSADSSDAGAVVFGERSSLARLSATAIAKLESVVLMPESSSLSLKGTTQCTSRVLLVILLPESITTFIELIDSIFELLDHILALKISDRSKTEAIAAREADRKETERLITEQRLVQKRSEMSDKDKEKLEEKKTKKALAKGRLFTSRSSQAF